MAADRNFDMSRALLDYPNEAAMIGNIIARWNVTEHTLHAIFAELTGTDLWHSQAMLAALVSSRSRLDIVQAAGEYTLKYEPLGEEFSSLMIELGKRLDARNYYAHSVYAVDEKKRLVRMTPGFDWDELVAKPWTQEICQPITFKALELELNAGVNANNSVSDFFKKLHASRAQPSGLSAAWLRRARGRTARDQSAQEANRPHSDKES